MPAKKNRKKKEKKEIVTQLNRAKSILVFQETLAQGILQLSQNHVETLPEKRRPKQIQGKSPKNNCNL